MRNIFFFLLLSMFTLTACSSHSVKHLNRQVWTGGVPQTLKMKYWTFKYTTLFDPDNLFLQRLERRPFLLVQRHRARRALRHDRHLNPPLSLAPDLHTGITPPPRAIILQAFQAIFKRIYIFFSFRIYNSKCFRNITSYFIMICYYKI